MSVLVVGFCSWIRPPLIPFPMDGPWAVSFGAVMVKAAMHVLVPVFRWTQALSNLWFTTRIGVSGSEGLVPKRGLLP